MNEIKYVSNINEIQDVPASAPPLHTGTVARKLVGKRNGAKNCALWYGEVESGGEVEAHIHEENEETFVVLEGECLFRIGDEEHRLSKGSVAFVPMNHRHELSFTGDTTAKLLVYMAPPPVSLEAWQRE